MKRKKYRIKYSVQSEINKAGFPVKLDILFTPKGRMGCSTRSTPRSGRCRATTSGTISASCTKVADPDPRRKCIAVILSVWIRITYFFVSDKNQFSS